jgi:hypothetical protein
MALNDWETREESMIGEDEGRQEGERCYRPARPECESEEARRVGVEVLK